MKNNNSMQQAGAEQSKAQPIANYDVTNLQQIAKYWTKCQKQTNKPSNIQRSKSAEHKKIQVEQSGGTTKHS